MKKILCCKGRIRTYTRQLAGKQGARAGGQPQSTFRLSRYPHPRDKRVCLPVSSPHNVVILKRYWDISDIGILNIPNIFLISQYRLKKCCKGRIRTYKRRLSSTFAEFIPLSSPTRPVGTSANFITSQFLLNEKSDI